MEEFQEKIGEILSDPESMAQVMKLVSALAPNMRGEVDKNRSADVPPLEAQTQFTIPEQESTHPPAVETAKIPQPSEMDRPSFQKPKNSFGTQKGVPPDRRCDLLLALKPYLKPSRAAMTDQIVQLLRVGNLLGIDIKDLFK